MPGFNYGGFGDGSGWSSESGGGPAPGGGSNGHGGDRDNNGSSASNGNSTPEQTQIDAIRNNATVRQTLGKIIQAARSINPYAKVTIESVSPAGILSISVTELSAEQAGQIGLSGLIMGVDTEGAKLAIGNLPTGITRIGKNETFDHTPVPVSADNIISGKIGWSYDPKTDSYFMLKDMGLTFTNLQITGPNTFRLNFALAKNKPIDATVHNGDPNNITKIYNNWKGPVGNYDRNSNIIVKDFVNFKLTEERELLIQASDLLISVGEPLSNTIGQHYRDVANQIASDIRNFQGKNVRTLAEATEALNRVLNNANTRIHADDREALLNAWKHMNATDMAYKLGFLGKAFKFADILSKVEKGRQKTIEGLETGNWTPLLMEVESWVVSGLASGLALSILAYYAPFIAATIGMPLIAVTILGVISITVVASLIDANLVEKINNNIINALK